jgi:hypothetical protein
MKKLEIIPVRNDAYDCIQGLIVAVAEYKNWNYKLMYLRCWGFEYDNEKGDGKLIGERISRDCYDWIDVLEKYHGIRTNFYKNENHVLLSKKIQEKIYDDKPVILHLSTFWCPWNYAYKKYHMSHYCLAIGINEDLKKIICIDPYMTDAIQSLDFEDIMHVEDYGILELESNNSNEWEIKEVLNEVINKIDANTKYKNMFDSMLLFADELENSDILKSELTGYSDIYMIPIIREIKKISASRKAFAETLDYIFIESNYDKLGEVCEKIRKASNIWDSVRLLLIKMAVTNIDQNYVNRITQHVRKVAALEKEIYLNLYSLI